MLMGKKLNISSQNMFKMYSTKAITIGLDLFIYLGFLSLSTLYRSYHDG